MPFLFDENSWERIKELQCIATDWRKSRQTGQKLQWFYKYNGVANTSLIASQSTLHFNATKCCSGIKRGHKTMYQQLDMQGWLLVRFGTRTRCCLLGSECCSLDWMSDSGRLRREFCGVLQLGGAWHTWLCLLTLVSVAELYLPVWLPVLLEDDMVGWRACERSDLKERYHN